MKTSSSEHIIEIRFKPNSQFLDHRGAFAEALSQELKFKEWSITDNRIQIKNPETKQTAFVGFRNAGFITLDSPTADFFSDHAKKFFKHLLNLEFFEKPLSVERLGVRSRFFTITGQSLKEIKDQYIAKFLAPRESVEKIMNAELIDIGGPLNFKDKEGHSFNTMSGPMSQEQAHQFFPQHEEMGSAGLYYDEDYFARPTDPLTENEIVSLIKDFSKSQWDRNQMLISLIKK